MIRRASNVQFTGVWLLALVISFGAVAQDDQGSRIRLSEQSTLAALIEFCARQLELDIEYPADELRRTTVSLRMDSVLDDEALWSFTTQLLVRHGWTTLQQPDESLITVHRLDQAARHVVPQSGLHQNPRAEFISLVRRAEHLAPAALIAAIKPLLSPTLGTVVQLGDSDRIVITDLRSRLGDVLTLIDELDRADASREVVVDRWPVRFIEATQLVALVTSMAQSRDTIAARPLGGKVIAAATGDAVMIVAPRATLSEWRSLLEQFDQQEPTTQRMYRPTRFRPVEVARLIEQSIKPIRGASPERWRIIVDDLTGTLIVVATASEHRAIDALLERLDEAPSERGQSMRTFTIRNRSVDDVLEVLQQVLDSTGPGPTSSTVDTRPDASDSMPDRSTAAVTGQRAARSDPTSPNPNSAPSAVLLTADLHTNTLIAIGDPYVLTQIESLITSLDVRQPQVELEISIVNLNDADTLDLGVELQKLEVSGETLIGLSSLFGLSDLSPASGDPLGGGRGGSGVILSPGDFSVVIRALRTINQGRTRSFPRLLVNNNEQATLDAVRQEPFASTNASDTVATTSFGGTLDAGTQLTVTPHIASGDHLVLEYSVALSAFVGDSSDPSLPPPRQQSSIQSVVTIPDGWTIAVGGLEATSEADAVSQVPLLGNLPGIGELFKSRSRLQSRARFFVFIRATVLRHHAFADLRHRSDQSRAQADIPDDEPTLEPRIIR